MPKYVYDKDLGIMVDKDTGLPMLNQEERARPLQAPKAFGDLPGYQSPVTGEWIEGRRARKYDLEKHGCVPSQDLKPYGYEGKKLKNRKFAKKRGLEHLLHEGARDATQAE